MIGTKLVQDVIGDLEMENRYWEDEAPEHFLGNEGLLKELINRLDKVEVELFKSKITQNEKKEIFERLTGTEKLLNRSIAKTQAELMRVNNRIRDFRVEIDILKKSINDIKQTLNTNNKKKKGLLSRMFT